MTIGSAAHAFKSIADISKIPMSHHHPSLQRIFNINAVDAMCKTTPQLSAKYNVDIQNTQTIISIENKVTLDLTLFNPNRKNKPQNFKSKNTISNAPLLDPTQNGLTCDFCKWRDYTAEDTFGRIERPHAVSASNLFKYNAPYQGVILFKHHDPLSFNLEQLTDMLHVANEWFDTANEDYYKNKTKHNPSSLYEQPPDEQQQQLFPLFVWNALNRAGASQFHGHAQVQLSSIPFPTQQREHHGCTKYSNLYNGADYYDDLATAHDSIGLARYVSIVDDGTVIIESDDATTNSLHIADYTEKSRTVAFASLCPYKDCELIVQGSSLTCPAFIKMFYSALRTVIDELGHQSFNAGIYSVDASRIVAKVVSRGALSSSASDFGGLEVFAGASIGHTDPYRVKDAFDKVYDGVLHM